jgi:hypothetical protein
MVRKIPAALALGLLVVTPALADDCVQTFKKTPAQLKASIIGPMSTAAAGDLVAKAGPLCESDTTQQARGIALLRDARAIIGE